MWTALRGMPDKKMLQKISVYEKFRNILTRAIWGFILSHICTKAMTKTVLHQRKPQRAGAGGNRCKYLLGGISLLSLSPKCMAGQERQVSLGKPQSPDGRVGTDVFPTLQGTGIIFLRSRRIVH